jgi:hypothetical protein
MIALIATNDSQHSTVSAQEPLKQSLSPVGSATCQSPNTKRVHVNESANVAFSNTQRCAEDCHETWYARQDYKDFRAECKDIIFSVSMIEDESDQDSFSGILKALFEAVSDINVVFEDASSIAHGLEQKLAALYTVAGEMDLIGLEFNIAGFIQSESKQRRIALQEVVAEIQGEHDQGLWSDAEVAQEYCESCCNYSQACCLFAQLLAKAQLKA